ncbi:MAG: AEC family transporter [Lachnospiraceae bacterium]|nr:AEC family transporter [Lachnospiraceae bacterium]
MDFSNIIIALCKLFFLLLLGYFLHKKKILDTHTDDGISSLIVNATNPALILSSLGATGASTKSDVLRLVLFGAGFYMLLLVLAFFMVRLFRIQRSKRNTAQLLLIFSNTGFMAIPVLQTLYGDIAVFYCSILNLPFNFLIYSYGVYLLTRDAQTSTAHKISLRQLINPGIVASVLALVLYFSGLHLPSAVQDTLGFLGNVTPPLSMLLLGSVLADYPLASMFKDGRLNLMLFVKLLLLPALAYVFSVLLFSDSVIIGINTLTFAMPCAAMTVMLCKEYKGDSMSASVGVVFSTVLSLLTIPLIFAVFILH